MPKFSLAVVISIPALFHGLSLSALAGNELPSWLSNLKRYEIKTQDIKFSAVVKFVKSS